VSLSINLTVYGITPISTYLYDCTEKSMVETNLVFLYQANVAIATYTRVSISFFFCAEANAGMFI